MEPLAIALTFSNAAALVLAAVMARRARYWRSVVEGPHGSRLEVPDTIKSLSGDPRSTR